MRKQLIVLFITLLVTLSMTAATQAQTTDFTYQGKLTDAGTPASGNYDLQFKLFDTVTVGTGTMQGAIIDVRNPVAVSEGIFTVTLNFGANVFDGADRYLEIGVRPAGSVNPYTVLAPRQPITSTPYAIQTLKAAALSSACVGCVQDAQINGVAGSKITGTIPVTGIPAGSTNYIQNGTLLQSLSNFNISGSALIGGNVGIGTVAPTDKLTVQTATSNYGLTHTDGIASIGTYVGAGSSGYGGWLGTKSNHPLYFFANGGNALMTVAASGNVGVGTITPQARLHINGTSWFQGDTTPLTASAGKGVAAGFSSSLNAGYLFAFDYGATAPQTLALNSPGGMVGIGTFAPTYALDVLHTGHTGIRSKSTADYSVMDIDAFDGQAGLRFFNNGAGKWVISNEPSNNNGTLNDLTINAYAGAEYMRFQTGSGNIGIGTTNPLRTLTVIGRARVASIPIEASVASVCFNGAGDLLNCGASSLRWKKDVQPYRTGLDVVLRLRPISFNWKEDGRADIGLGAEDVAQVAPSLVFTNSQSEVEGVKYEKLNLLLINSVKEQQKQIEQQKHQVSDLKNQLEGMKKLICAFQHVLELDDRKKEIPCAVITRK